MVTVLNGRLISLFRNSALLVMFQSVRDQLVRKLSFDAVNVQPSGFISSSGVDLESTEGTPCRLLTLGYLGQGRGLISAVDRTV